MPYKAFPYQEFLFTGMTGMSMRELVRTGSSNSSAVTTRIYVLWWFRCKLPFYRSANWSALRFFYILRIRLKYSVLIYFDLHFT